MSDPRQCNYNMRRLSYLGVSGDASKQQQAAGHIVKVTGWSSDVIAPLGGDVVAGACLRGDHGDVASVRYCVAVQLFLSFFPFVPLQTAQD